MPALLCEELQRNGFPIGELMVTEWGGEGDGALCLSIILFCPKLSYMKLTNVKLFKTLKKFIIKFPLL